MTIASIIRTAIQNMIDRPVDHTLRLLLGLSEDWRAEERYWSLAYQVERRAQEWIDIGGEG